MTWNTASTQKKGHPNSKTANELPNHRDAGVKILFGSLPLEIVHSTMMGYIGVILGLYRGLYRDNGKENGNYYNGLYRGYIRVI